MRVMRDLLVCVGSVPRRPGAQTERRGKAHDGAKGKRQRFSNTVRLTVSAVPLLPQEQGRGETDRISRTFKQTVPRQRARNCCDFISRCVHGLSARVGPRPVCRREGKSQGQPAARAEHHSFSNESGADTPSSSETSFFRG